MYEKEELVYKLVSMIYGNKIVGFDKSNEFLVFVEKIIELVNKID